MTDDACEVAGHCLLIQLRDQLSEVEAARDALSAELDAVMAENEELGTRLAAAEAKLAEVERRSQAVLADHLAYRGFGAATWILAAARGEDRSTPAECRFLNYAGQQCRMPRDHHGQCVHEQADQ